MEFLEKFEISLEVEGFSSESAPNTDGLEMTISWINLVTLILVKRSGFGFIVAPVVA